MTISIDTTNRVIHYENFDFQYSADDFVNADSWDFIDDFLDKHTPRAWVIHNAGFVLAIVFEEYPAFTDQDALDAAVDANKLDGLLVSESELDDYKTGEDSEGNPEYEGIVYLGNASEPFASETLEYFIVDARLFRTDEVIQAVIAANEE